MRENNKEKEILRLYNQMSATTLINLYTISNMGKGNLTLGGLNLNNEGHIFLLENALAAISLYKTNLSVSCSWFDYIKNFKLNKKYRKTKIKRVPKSENDKYTAYTNKGFINAEPFIQELLDSYIDAYIGDSNFLKLINEDIFKKGKEQIKELRKEDIHESRNYNPER